LRERDRKTLRFLQSTPTTFVDVPIVVDLRSIGTE